MKHILGAVLCLLLIVGCESDSVTWRLQAELSQNFKNINESLEVLAIEIWKTNRKISRLSRKLRRANNE